MTGALTFEEFKRKAESGQLTPREAEEWIKELGRLYRNTAGLIKLAYEIANDPQSRRELYNIYRRLTLKNTSDLANSLRRTGYAIARDNPDICSSFEKMGYRIMELARHGHRDIVFGMILRIFFAANKGVPEDLSKIFQPVYPDDVFRTLLYSFLSGVFSAISETGCQNKGGEA